MLFCFALFFFHSSTAFITPAPLFHRFPRSGGRIINGHTLISPLTRSLFTKALFLLPFIYINAFRIIKFIRSYIYAFSGFAPFWLAGLPFGSFGDAALYPISPVFGHAIICELLYKRFLVWLATVVLPLCLSYPPVIPFFFWGGGVVKGQKAKLLDVEVA